MQVNKKRKLAIIGTVGLPANYGGFETLAEHIVENMSSDYDISVYCSSKKYAKSERKAYYKGARLLYIPLNANGVQSIFYDTISIIHSLLFAEVLLILGVSGAWILPIVRLFTNKKIIISIDGIEWKRNKWSPLAKAYLWWAESIAIKYSHFDISDNESIQDYTAMRYGSLSKVIEYGADHTMRIEIQDTDLKDYPFLKNPYAFKVCRIEPENNIHLVLESFSKITNLSLVIVGNWNNSEYGKKLLSIYSKFPSIHLLDPIYNQEKLDLLRGNASLYIHGHSAGGTNPSLVEAMYLRLPIISFNACYNVTTTEGKALYFSTVEELVSHIKNLTVDALDSLSDEMYSIASRRYKWSVITEKYRYLFEEVFSIRRKVTFKKLFLKKEFSEMQEIQATHLLHSKYFFETQN